MREQCDPHEQRDRDQYRNLQRRANYEQVRHGQIRLDADWHIACRTGLSVDTVRAIRAEYPDRYQSLYREMLEAVAAEAEQADGDDLADSRSSIRDDGLGLFRGVVNAALIMLGALAVWVVVVVLMRLAGAHW